MLTEVTTNKVKNKLSVYGAGFVLGNYCKSFQDKIIKIPRDDLHPQSNSVLYGISTVHNYGVYTNPFLDIETNLTHLIRVLDSCKTKFGSDFTFVFLSSWFVYGKSDPIAKEDSPCNPTGFYSSTKLCAERLLKSYCETFGIRYKILRLANVLGAGDKKASLQKNAFQFLVKEMVQGRDVSIYDVPSYRDFINVTDAISAIDLCMNDVYWDEIYNIGNGKSHNVKDLLYYAHKKANSAGKVIEMEVPGFHKIVQVPIFRMNVEKLFALGYSPKCTVWDTIDELILYYRKNK